MLIIKSKFYKKIKKNKTVWNNIIHFNNENITYFKEKQTKVKYVHETL